ncbi:MAG: nitrogenase [Clostridiales Family XIII bacterium]|jgi:nitrogenase molybdenum-iron protein alpha chain|nr:nitrogenase [Clostridiales Family XIII bacterium]
MAKKKTKALDLKLANVDSREMRLGSIISWDGSASELVEISQYEQRSRKHSGSGCGVPCGERGKSCRLAELNMPFSQQTMCAQSIVACQIGNITDCILIEHSPIGCSAYHPRFNFGYKVGLLRRGKKLENIRIFSTNLQENDMVFGAGGKLRQSIRDAYDRFSPKAVFISMSCSTAIIGEDIGSIAVEMEKALGIPVVPLFCEGFRSKHWSTGFDISQHGVVRQIVRKKRKKQDDLLNIVALWGTDYFTEMLAPLGLRVNYMIDMASFDELAQASEAAATATFCHTLGSYMATALEEKFGVPQIDAPQPYGVAATDEWLRAVAKAVGKEDIIEEYIESEHARILPRLKKLREQLKGVRGFVSTGSAFAHSMVEVIRELGVDVEGSLVFHHDPVYDSGYEKQNTLKHLVDNYGDIPNFSVSKTQQYQFYALLKRANPDFIVIRHNGVAPLAAKMGIPSFAMGDEHFPLGYDGIIRMGDALIGILARKKFNNVLKRHVSLPYTDWWLSQEDPFILAKHPEILDEAPTAFDDFKEETYAK